MVKEISVNIETENVTITLRTNEKGMSNETYVYKNLQKMKSYEIDHGSNILAVMYTIELIKRYMKKE